MPWKGLDSIVSAPRHPRDGWDSVISGPWSISAPRYPWNWRDQYFQLPKYLGDYRDAIIPGSQVPSGLAGLGHFSPPSTLWTDGDSVTSVPPVFWALAGLSNSKPHGHSGPRYRSDSRDSICSAPQVLGTAGLNRFSPQASSGRAWLSHFRPPGYFSPQARLGLAGSVILVAQVPWGETQKVQVQVPSGLSGLGHFGRPCTLWTDVDSVTSVPPVFCALAGLCHSKPHGS